MTADIRTYDINERMLKINETKNLDFGFILHIFVFMLGDMSAILA